MCVSASVCVSCAFTLALLFVLSYSDLFVLVFLCGLLFCLFSNMRKKGCGFWWMVRWGGSGRR